MKPSKAVTIQELGRQFAKVVGAMFSENMIGLAYRVAEGQTWEPLIDKSGQAMEKLSAFQDHKLTGVSEIHEGAGWIAIIHKLHDKSLISLVISEGDARRQWTDFDIMTLRLFVSLFDNAYRDMLHKKTEKSFIFSLNHRILQLNSLIDTGIEVSTIDENVSPHRLALTRAAALTNAAMGLVTVRRGKEIVEQHAFPEGSDLHHVKAGENKIMSSFSFSDETFTFELFDKESRTGTQRFEETDQLLLDALARQVHASLENRYLHQQALEKQRIEQEMVVAAEIQQKIIPVSLPKISGYDVAGRNIPSKSVGGDYYDCLPISDGRYALVIADVTGKGMPAALLVSSLHAYLSAYLELSNSLPTLLTKLNKALYNATTDDKFVTAFFALLTPGTGEIEYSSAGHNPAYLLRNGTSVEKLQVGGPPLGAFDIDFPYDSERVRVGKGECLFLYTDGITEATNAKNEMYEEKIDLSDFMAKRRKMSAENFITDLIADIQRFAGPVPQSDDMTVLYLARNG